MAGTRFNHPVDVNFSKFRFELFKETQRVRGFDSGSKPLDDFLNTEEVEEYENEGLGTTTLVFCDGEVIAYSTICMDGLRLEYVKDRKLPRSHVRRGEAKVEVIPALKIGRLAVAKTWQNRGVGRLLIRHIVAQALSLREKAGVRLVILQAKPESVEFYTKCGFEMTVETRRERGRGSRTMFLDLQAIEDVV